MLTQRVERSVALDIQIHIKSTADVNDNNAEKVSVLNIKGIVVIEGKKVGEFLLNDLPADNSVIKAVIPIRMEIDNPLTPCLAP